MSFVQHCTDASASLLALSTHLEVMEKDILELETTRDSTALIAKIVADLFAAKDLTDDLLHRYIPSVADEEPSVALAMRIALQELTKRYWGVRDDLEILTKTADRRVARPSAPVLQFVRGGRASGRQRAASGRGL